MSGTRKTPGVYIVEKNAFPNAVVQVATGVPVFIGYTQKAVSGSRDLSNVPTRIGSLAEYQALFGDGHGMVFSLSGGAVADGGGLTPVTIERSWPRYQMQTAMRLFFANGGGACWILSVGGFTGPIEAQALRAPLDAGGVLEREAEPDLLCIPDAVSLSGPDHAGLANAVIDHCARMGSRVAIVDVHQGFAPLTGGDDDPVDGVRGFRKGLTAGSPSFGVAYYPWLNASVLERSEVGAEYMTRPSLAVLGRVLADEGQRRQLTNLEILGASFVERAKPLTDDKRPKLARTTAEAGVAAMTLAELDTAAEAASADYRAVMERVLATANVAPPAAAMAGVYAAVDNARGVFKAPANVSLASVVSPVARISQEQQEDLNVSATGISVNAIKTFVGEGTLVWGARTLDGNSPDWRYVNVRRTAIMLEKSIKTACRAYVFEPNTATTWVTVKGMIQNFMTSQWKMGALAGSAPGEAFAVNVGLGSTMTATDVQDGKMRVVVGFAIIRPAEFIVLEIVQDMQTS